MDLRNLLPIVPKSLSVAAKVPSTPENLPEPIADDVVELAHKEETVGDQVEVEAAAEAEEVAEDIVEAPRAPRTRKLPLHFEGNDRQVCKTAKRSL
jgi:hypothetical protein